MRSFTSFVTESAERLRNRSPSARYGNGHGQRCLAVRPFACTERHHPPRCCASKRVTNAAAITTSTISDDAQRAAQRSQSVPVADRGFAAGQQVYQKHQADWRHAGAG